MIQLYFFSEKRQTPKKNLVSDWSMIQNIKIKRRNLTANIIDITAPRRLYQLLMQSIFYFVLDLMVTFITNNYNLLKLTRFSAGQGRLEGHFFLLTYLPNLAKVFKVIQSTG